MEIALGPWILAEEPVATPRPGRSRPRVAELMDPSVAAEELMKRYRRGDEAAFQQLYECYRSPLLRFVRRMSLDAAEAEEIAQETWMAVILGRERYTPKARFVTYLFSIARRRTMDRWRRRGRTFEQMREGDSSIEAEGPCTCEPEWLAVNAALGAALVTAVSALPLLQREAFLLRAEGGLGLEEIAQVTGTNQETAKSRLRYALQKLRIALESWE